MKKLWFRAKHYEYGWYICVKTGEKARWRGGIRNMVKEALFPNEVITRTASFSVYQDCEIPIAGFFIISSNRNISSIAEFNESEEFEFTQLVIDLRRKMKQVLGVEQVYVFQNEDSEHNFHVWMFPRHDWMEQFGKKIESVRKIMEYAKNHMVFEENMIKVREAVNLMKQAYGN